VASGLLVTGGTASLAFASPEDSTSGDTTGGTDTEQPADPTGTAPVVVVPPGTTTGSTGTSGTKTRPTSTVGNGRTDVEPPTGSEPVTGTPATPAPSKSEEPPVPADPQTGEEGSGELEEANPEVAAKGDSDTTATGTPAVAAAVPTTEPDPAGEPDPVIIVPGEEGLVTLADPDDPAEQPAFQWPWSWWFKAQPTSGDSGGGSTGEQPAFTPPRLPQMQLPQLRFPDLAQLQGTLTQIPGQWVTDFTNFAKPWLDAVTGLATAASQLPFQPIALPDFPAGAGAGAGAGGGGGGGTAGGATVPGVPRLTPPVASRPEGTPGVDKPAEQTAPREQERISTDATATSNELLAAPTYRMGYVDYLRGAGLGQVAAVAVPGVTGILVLTGAGGLIGYRQARAGRAVRAGGPARFMG
jgi:hypothetical protein